MCPRERFTSYKSLSRLVLCYKKDWATLLHLIYFCYLLLVTIILSQNYLLPLISVLAENALLETAYHFLLLLVGFDTLTYRMDYDRSPILVGHQRAIPPPPPSYVSPRDAKKAKKVGLPSKKGTEKMALLAGFSSEHRQAQ